ncbi:MAG TPA: carboxypeptidase regulatory-like domain-containing protein, partial [Thermoanaerobaculia bacterium]|nr:carboxypeptidase regulatory-like domain-containing protein [Thermoanaerobaculia bacterium]
MTSLIGRIAVQPTVVRPGETVRVEVFDHDDNPLDGSRVTINGVPGSLQFLQFPSAGQRRLSVRATNGAGSDHQVALLDVTGPPLQFPSIHDQNDIAMIGVTQSATRPYTAILTLGSFIDVRSPHVLGNGHSLTPLGLAPFREGSRAVRLGTRGLLAKMIAQNSHMLTRVETRRLAQTRTKKSAASGDRTLRQAKRTTRRAVGAVYDLTNIDIHRVFERSPKLALIGYEWDFGDGRTATTRTPTVSHDYFRSIDHAGGVGQFVVTCKVLHTGLTVSRTLTIGSAYALCRKTGTIVPHVDAELFAYKRFTMVEGSFTVYNVEEEKIVLDRVSITATSDHGDAVALPRPFVNLGKPITIAPNSMSEIAVNVPFIGSGTPQNGQLRYDAAGFTVIYAGTCGSYPVRCTAVFDIPVEQRNQKPRPPELDEPILTKKPWPWEIVEDFIEQVVNPPDEVTQPGIDVVLDAKTGTLAVALGSLDDTRTRSEVRTQAMRVKSAVYAPIQAMELDLRMGKEPVKRKLSFDRMAGKKNGFSMTPKLTTMHHQDGGVVAHKHDGPPPPGFIAEGQICDPDNLTEADLAAADEAQLVCQLTDETKDVRMPARWMNARKGDCILSPGGEGIIGGLMLNVSPPQWYSHSGIMTRNYDEITHSTGSQKRLMDHLVGVLSDGSDGFEPSVLKWVWPGAVRQTVEHSIVGETFPDPEYDKAYSISAFGPHTVGITHNDQMKMIPPLVLKPDPMQETPAVRTALHAIATDAAANAGRPGVKPKYHYRWYCYTDPKIGLGAPEGPEAGWAAGTRPSVCSSYIWMHAKARNAALETTQALVTPTDLEPGDVATGAAVRPITPDGLYTYSADERLKAGRWLFDTIYNQAYEKAGWFGEILTDGADDIANQFLNAFANDDADGKDSDEWENVVAADAVSPDDMMWWDGPSKGGLYGYVEPALYREPRIESYTVSKWKKVLNRGTVRGTVRGDSGPVAGALVQVYEGKSTFSAGDGTYTLKDVPLGNYMLKASKVIDGVLYSAQVNVNVNVADQVIDIQLQPPSERFRIAQIFLDFWGRDEENFSSDEIHDP